MLGDRFERTDNNAATTHAWTRWARKQEDGGVRALAAELAAAMMRYRCAGALRYADAWERVRGGGPAYSDQERAGVIAFVKPLFGLPAKPKSMEHAQGAVAEHLWYFMVQVLPTDAPFAIIHGPGFHATSPGGDGLVIYEGDRPEYRLWEIKKHASTAHVSRTILVAYRQLRRSAEEYLAQYSMAGQHGPDPRMARIYGELIERWVRADSQAGVGIAVTTSNAPRKSFSTFPTEIPRFANKHSRQGLLIGVDDLHELTESVRDMLWTGL